MLWRGLIVVSVLAAATFVGGCDSSLPRPDYVAQQASPQQRGPDGLRIDSEGFRLDSEGYRVDANGNRVGLVPPTRDDTVTTIMGR